MTVFIRPALALAIAAAVAAPATAQDARAAATAVVDLTSPEPRAKAQLEAQLKAMRSGEIMRNMLNQNPGFRDVAAKNPTGVNAAMGRIGAMQADALGPIQREMLTASRQAAIAAYAREFTVPELQAIAAFYRSPAGAKLLARQGAINAEVARQMQQKFGPRVQAAEKALQPKIQAELQKLAPGGGAPK